MTRIFSITMTFALSLPFLSAEDWTRFRGDNGQGIGASAAPVKWADDNIKWKTNLPGEGSSSPIVVGNRVFLTCWTEDARTIVCVNAETGKIDWQDSVSPPQREDGFRGYITEHGYASGTPTSDGTNVYAFFGKAGVSAWTVEGKKLWTTDVGQMSANRRWGSGSSPVLHGETLIVNASEEARAIIGLNTKDGSEKWRAEYAGLELCYATPVLVKGDEDVMEAVISMPGEVWGLNVETGKLRWFCETETPGNVSPGVVVTADALFTFGGYPQEQTNAIRRGGRKDISKTHRLWQARESSYVPTPLALNGNLQWVSDKGMVIVLNAKSGEIVTRRRLTGLAAGGRPIYASPVLVGNHIYVVTRRSGTYVFEANSEMKQVTVNSPLDESDFNATPAVSNGRLFLRSNTALYCIR